MIFALIFDLFDLFEFFDPPLKIKDIGSVKFINFLSAIIFKKASNKNHKILNFLENSHPGKRLKVYINLFYRILVYESWKKISEL